MGIGFGSGILLDLVLFAARTNAEPKSYLSILWDIRGLQRFERRVCVHFSSRLFLKYLNTYHAPRQQVAARRLESGPSYIEEPSPSWLSLCFSRGTIGYNNSTILVFKPNTRVVLDCLHRPIQQSTVLQYSTVYCSTYSMVFCLLLGSHRTQTKRIAFLAE